MQDTDDIPERRAVLQSLAAASAAGMAALAGCGTPSGEDEAGGGGAGDGGAGGGDGGDGGDGEGGDADGGGGGDGEDGADGEDRTETEVEEDGADEGDTISGSEYPAVDEWLTETEVGDAAPNYQGDIAVQRDTEEVTVRVGVGENGYQFDPPAVAVTAGTNVVWEWTGEGGQHNVFADPDAQIGESDFEFRSGDPVEGDDVTFEQSFDEVGTALYHCEPHLGLGMKGAIVVE